MNRRIIIFAMVSALVVMSLTATAIIAGASHRFNVADSSVTDSTEDVTTDTTSGPGKGGPKKSLTTPFVLPQASVEAPGVKGKDCKALLKGVGEDVELECEATAKVLAVTCENNGEHVSPDTSAIPKVQVTGASLLQANEETKNGKVETTTSATHLKGNAKLFGCPNNNWTAIIGALEFQEVIFTLTGAKTNGTVQITFTCDENGVCSEVQ